MSVEQYESVTGREESAVTQPAATELVAGAVFVAIAIIAARSLLTDPYLELGKVGNDPGPAFIPWIGTWVIGLGGVAQLIWTLLRARKAGGMRTTGEFVGAKLWLPTLLVLSLIGYQVAMRPLGFVTASIAFAIPWVAIIHWRSGGVFTRRHILQLPLEAMLIVASIYLVFSYGINVPFP
ncbi:tripartite tricarboxylate transporter TctB family protein [Pseudochelatococcus sp. B33]